MQGEQTEVLVEGQRARVLTAGRGDDVVVLHGWGGRIESMAPTISCLAQAFRVTALDLPGFGESPVPETAWGTPEYAAFVAGAVGKLGIDRARFVGHSYGAKTSLYLAATRPELVERLVAVGSSGLRRAPSFGTRVKRGVSRTGRALGRLGAPGRSARDAIYRRIASSDYLEAGALRPILVKVVNEDLSDLLPRIQAPTLLVWGTKDDAVPVAHARRMESLIADSGLVLFEGAGHFAYLDEPERFCAIVRHFFGRPLS
jgi:pimeloyl-ACP methyl ester carboxylesterase